MRRAPLLAALGAGAALVVAPGVAAQPPYVGGQWLEAPDRPGQPLPVTDVRDSDGQFCGRMCNADAQCTGFNYAPYGCASSPACPHKAGCCWLKAGAIAAAQINATGVPGCASSFVMRPGPQQQETAAVAAPSTTTTPTAAPPGAKNVLYILVDDLRPDVAPFGADWMVTPALSALAAAGTTFDRAYTAISVCSPSRMAFLTGRYPHHTGTWNFVNHFRQADCVEVPGASVAAGVGGAYSAGKLLNGGAGQCCSDCTADARCVAWAVPPAGGKCLLYNASVNTGLVPGGAPGGVAGGRGATTRRSWTSLPQHFLNSGYLTLGSGKVFHTEEGGTGPAPWVGPGTGMPPLQDPPSWSPGNSSMANVNALAPMRPCDARAPPAADGCDVDADKAGNVPVGTFTLEDRTIADDALAKLAAAVANRAATGQPFFLAAGFRKPHLPFRHPAPWSQIYPNASDIPLAKYKVLDASQPPIAFHQTGLAANPYVPMPDEQAGRMRRDYYGAISWTDSQIGRVLDALYAVPGLANDTLVVFHSDHGWSLGEHGEWEKFTNFEHGTRVPLIVSAPWLPGSAGARSPALASLVDVFPTMAALAGVPAPAAYGLDGQDLSPVLTGAPPQLRNYSLSVYPRCPADTKNASNFWADNDCLLVERSAFPFMGLSLRADRWRYTEWRAWNGSSLAPIVVEGADPDDPALVAVELYDHTGDDGGSFDGPYEVANLAGDPGHAAVCAGLAAVLRAVYPDWAVATPAAYDAWRAARSA